MSDPSEVTGLLLAWSDGDEAARERLMPLVFDELRRIARRYLDREGREHTLQPTALVNELYLKLIDRRRVQWKNRAQFFGVAAEMMRRILVDYARGRLTQKRGREYVSVPLEESRVGAEEQDFELVALDDALKTLAELDPRQAKVVELRFFAGLTHEEIGEVLEISATTVKREWRTARLWLRREIGRR
jgi:RNA polymerase sigma factor (TIGR02999 family)